MHLKCKKNYNDKTFTDKQTVRVEFLMIEGVYCL